MSCKNPRHAHLVEIGRIIDKDPKPGNEYCCRTCASSHAASNRDMASLGAMGGRATVCRHGLGHMRKIGAAGRQAVLDAYGEQWYREHVCSPGGKERWKQIVAAKGRQAALEWLAEIKREYRLENPSCLEKTVMTALDGAGIFYEREPCLDLPAPNEFATADFSIGKVAIFVDGEIWHSPNFAGINGGRHITDALIRQAAQDAGWIVVVLSEYLVNQGATAILDAINMCEVAA